MLFPFFSFHIGQSFSQTWNETSLHALGGLSIRGSLGVQAAVFSPVSVLEQVPWGRVCLAGPWQASCGLQQLDCACHLRELQLPPIGGFSPMETAGRLAVGQG